MGSSKSINFLQRICIKFKRRDFNPVVFVDNDFIIEQVTLTGNDFQLIKQDITEFLTKALESMKKMIAVFFRILLLRS